MTSFFTILFIIIGINAVLMIFSLGGSNQKIKKSSTAASRFGFIKDLAVRFNIF